MQRPLLLDLFCGAGGASEGYYRAGFDVVGVDVKPQPHYPFPFCEGDALELLNCLVRGGYFRCGEQGRCLYLEDFAAIHTSPPCHAYVQWSGINREKWGGLPDHPDLIAETRSALECSGRSWVIENVVGSPLLRPITLCGSFFGLGVRRHRLFESSVPLFISDRCRHTRNEVAVYGKLDGRRIWTRADGSEARAARTIVQASVAMGINWMEWGEITQAIPPAYTAFIGRQLLAALGNHDS